MPGSAVLLSGGLDSAVLLARELAADRAVLPVHVLSGLSWEPAEIRTIDRLLALPPFAGRADRAVRLSIDMRDVYPATHWAVTGQAPRYDTPDEDVYLPGRNVTLISKAAVLCARLGISRLVLGPLSGNPFPDARPEFLDCIGRALTLGLDHPIQVEAPFLTRHKEDVIRIGLDLGVPLAITLSCMSPAAGDRHCGRCSKCRERQDAFRAAGVDDPTEYAAVWTA